MPKFKQTKILPHPAKLLYDLVMDIETYPEFLPWCKKAKITKIISEKNLEADLVISFKGFIESYSSNVSHGINNQNYFVDVTAIKGPFKNLVNQWTFRNLENNESCEVTFFIDFQFNSFLLEKMISPIFERATEKMISAFEARANTLKGVRPLL